MNKSQWFIQRKRIPLTKTVFNWLIVGAGAYILTLSIIFLVEYFISENWQEIVERNRHTFDSKDSYEDTYNAVKMVYLIRFWANVFVGLLMEFLAFWYYKKTTTGYGFYSIWLIMIVGLLITNFMLVKDNWYTSLISTASLLLMSTGLIIGLVDLYQHRKALNRAYLEKVRKGEL